MDSFDLFDTLIAGRNVAVAAGNQDTQFPIAENIAKVQPDSWIVSDYEHEDRAAALVHSLGLDNAVVVTPDGKWAGSVWATLPVKPETHTGDNQRADVDSPNQHGIKGVLSTLHKFSEAEKYLNDKGLKQLAMLCREARLRTFGKYRGIELLQVNYNFPVLFLASVVLNHRHPSETLLMSGRDCFMWQKLMQRVFGRGVYWQTSVIARTNADENYHRYIQSLGPDPVLVDISGSGNSFSKLPYPSILLYKPTHGVPEIPCMVTSKDCWRLEQGNCAPHEKCIGVDADLRPIFKPGTDYANHPETNAQVAAFQQCLDVMNFYDLTYELQLDDRICTEVMSHLMHQYVNFAAVVEPLRQLAIKDDA